MNESSTLRSDFRLNSPSNRSFFKAINVVLFIFLMFTIVQLQAQELSRYTMYQNSYSTFNPGATGLHNKYFASLTTRFPFSGSMYYTNAESLVYEQQVDKINSGFGTSITYKNNRDLCFDWIVALNYAYHFDFKDAGKLGVGISVGKIFRRLEFVEVSRGNKAPNVDTLSSRLLLNFGLAYNFKNLNLGFSVAEMYFKDYSKERFSIFDSNPMTFNAFGSYDIVLDKSFTLTPAINAIFNSGGNIFDYRMNLNVKERLWGGISFTNEAKDYYYNRNYKSRLLNVMAGYDILGKYRIGYALSKEIKSPESGNGYHEIGLAWMLK